MQRMQTIMIHRPSFLKAAPVIIALLALLSQSFFSGAASYYRTSIQDMTQRATAVLEVQVVSCSYPEMPADQFQRTNVEVSVLRTLKGSVPQNLTLDLPGGLRGNQVYSVPDTAEFTVGERAVVFVKEPAAGKFMVQDLGLGKFNVVSRDGKQFVESAVCPRAVQGGNDPANLLFKSIPYDDFCSLVSSYAAKVEPQANLLKMALALRNSTSHRCDPTKPCQLAVEAQQAHTRSNEANQWFNAGLCAAFVLLASALVVLLRHGKQRKAARVPAKFVAMVVVLALLAGAALGGSFSSAYVASGAIWNLNDTSTPTKVSNGVVVWKQSTQVSQSYPGCMNDVQTSFNKWASISSCRLGFTNAGTTTNTEHSGTDGVNFIVWDPNPSSDFSSATLAITYSVYTIGGQSYFLDGDIVFNDRDFTWGPSGHSVNSVSLHEIGHFIGLAHTTNTAAVMYPYDQGFTALTGDETLAAQTFYPGQSSGTTTTTPPPTTTQPSLSIPPTAACSASPVAGPPPLNSGFDGSASKAGTNPIASYAWNFGDGSSGTGVTAGHLYTIAGTYTATLTVTDTQGLNSTATQTITVAMSGQVMRATLKLNLKLADKDTLSLLLYSENTANYAPTAPVTGTFNLAGTPFSFNLSPSTLKGSGADGLQVTVSKRTGYVVVTMKNADLQAALTAAGHRHRCLGQQSRFRSASSSATAASWRSTTT